MEPILTVLRVIPNILFFFLTLGVYILIGLLGFVVLLVTFFKIKFSLKHANNTKQDDTKTVAFFHPYCDAGGGGERVLWVGLQAIRRKFPAAKLVVYTGDVGSAPDQIIARAKSRFNLEIDNENLEFIYLHRRKWVEAEMYPYVTLLGQSLGSVWLGKSDNKLIKTLAPLNNGEIAN